MRRGCGCRLLFLAVFLIAGIAWFAFALNFDMMQMPQSRDEAFTLNFLKGAVMATQMAAAFLFGWLPVR